MPKAYFIERRCNMVNGIITAGSIVGALTTLCGLILIVYKIIKRFEALEESGKLRKEESSVLIKSTFAMLDGLTQLGANGPVTKAKEELREYISKRGD
jgi:hypothetical protein